MRWEEEERCPDYGVGKYLHFRTTTTMPPSCAASALIKFLREGDEVESK